MAVKNKTEKKDIRLVRSDKDRILGGVCGGLAEFFNVDATIVRLIFVLIAVFGGSGVLLYLILWLIIPPSTSAGEISRSTIKNSADEMKDQAQKLADEAKDFSKRSNSKQIIGVAVIVLGLLFLFENFGIFHFINFGKLWPVILIIVGFLIITRNHEGK